MATRSLTVLSADPGGGPAPEAERAQCAEFILGCLCGGPGESPFVCRRAAQMLSEFDGGGDRPLIDRAVDPDRPLEERSCALVAWAARLESRNRLDEAAAALEAAQHFTPEDPSVLLHRGRIARKHGRGEAAREYYAMVESRVSDAEHPLARMARLGSALLMDDGGRSIGTVLRDCIRVGDHESAAVAHESRAHARMRTGDAPGAVRDLLLAVARYDDPIDRGRVGHALADILVSARRFAGARRVLEATTRIGHPKQAEWARSRLQQVARLAGDQLGVRRWSDAGSSGFVTLIPGGAGTSHDAIEAGWLDRALDRFERMEHSRAG